MHGAARDPLLTFFFFFFLFSRSSPSQGSSPCLLVSLSPCLLAPCLHGLIPASIYLLNLFLLFEQELFARFFRRGESLTNLIRKEKKEGKVQLSNLLPKGGSKWNKRSVTNKDTKQLAFLSFFLSHQNRDQELSLGRGTRRFTNIDVFCTWECFGDLASFLQSRFFLFLLLLCFISSVCLTEFSSVFGRRVKLFKESTHSRSFQSRGAVIKKCKILLHLLLFWERIEKISSYLLFFRYLF